MNCKKEITTKLNAKIKNRSKILRLLRNSDFISRVDIARELKLTRSAITNIIKEMIKEGLIRETSNCPIVSKNNPGPNKIYLEIFPDFKFVFGVAIERKTVSIGLTNINGNILGKRFYELQYTKNLTYLLKSIIRGYKEILEENCLSSENILAMGICLNESFFDGHMDREDLYNEISIVIKKQIGVPVCFEELTNGLALAEMDFYRVHDINGSSKKYLYINNEHNILASLAIKNKPSEDYILNKVNFGNMTLCSNQGLNVGLDKTNSINKFASLCSLKKTIDKLYCDVKNTNLHKIAEKKKTSVSELVLFDSKTEPNSAIIGIFNEACKAMAIGIFNFANIIDIEKIIFFGQIFENPNFVECFCKCFEKFLPKEIFEKICISRVNINAKFLSGCAIAVKDFLVKCGGYNPEFLEKHKQ